MACTVSAIMPTYNGARYLKAAIDSVLQQTYADWELVVVDDGSTDATPEILATYTDERIKVICLPSNQGRGKARNIAVQQSQGRYIAVCDGDDLSLPERFAKQVRYLEKNPEVGVVASQVLYFDEGMEPELRVLYPESPESIQARFRRGRSAVPNQSAMIRKELFDRHGYYSPECRRCQDLEFFLRVMEHTEFATLSEPLVHYRQSGGSPGLKYWLENASYQRYALYRWSAIKGGLEPAPYREYVKAQESWKDNLRDLLSFTYFEFRRRLLPKVKLGT